MLHSWRRKNMNTYPVTALPPRRVLIADDSAGMRAYLSVILAGAGYECVEACDGAQAFDIAFAGGIDLVVTDLNMPVMDGFALLSAISLMQPLWSRPPVIVVSGLLDETLARRRPELRAAAALLAKPVQAADLLPTVSRVMSARPARACVRPPRNS
jgi:two-component system, chemotaxis family, chemotaxis protein CheY